METLNNLPYEFSIDDLVDRLILIQKVEEAQKQSADGLKYSEEDAKKMIKRWSK